MMIAYINLFPGDGKPHPVEGFIGLLVLVAAIICFDKWVIRSEKTHERHYKPDKILKRSPSKRFWYSFLQMIEFFCGAYFCRSIRLDDEPFRKATETEKRVGGCFMALWPLFLAFMMSHTESFGAMVDSMMYGHHWMGWFYLGSIVLLGSGVFFAIKVAPKVPLFISIPIAIVSWPILAWVVWTHNLI
jgi:hypothetical protein